MASTVIAELTELREAVVSASEHTKRQLESVDSSLLPKSLLAIVVSMGITFLLKIALYWIPVSLLIMPLWGIFCIKPMLRLFQSEQVKKVQEAKRKLGDKKLDYGFTWLFTYLAPVINGLSIIYLGAFLVFLLVFVGVVQFAEELPTVVPLITLSIYLLAPLFLAPTISYSKRGGFSRDLESFLSMSDERSLSISGRLPSRRLAKVVKVVALSSTIFIVLVLPIFVLPILSLWLLRSIFWPFSTESWWLILVSFLQLATLATFSSYFSSLFARKELTNTITNLANIDYSISVLILNKNINEESALTVKNSFLAAKPYDLVIQHFLFFPYYSLVMRKEHLRQLGMESETRAAKE